MTMSPGDTDTPPITWVFGGTWCSQAGSYFLLANENKTVLKLVLRFTPKQCESLTLLSTSGKYEHRLTQLSVLRVERGTMSYMFPF